MCALKKISRKVKEVTAIQVQTIIMHAHRQTQTFQSINEYFCFQQDEEIYKVHSQRLIIILMSLKNNWKRHTDDKDKRTAGGAGDNEEVLSVPPAKRKKCVSDPLDMISNFLSRKRNNDDECVEVIFLSSLSPDTKKMNPPHNSICFYT